VCDDAQVFATLLGGLPKPVNLDDADELIRIAVRAQDEAGLEPITDGRLSDLTFDRAPTADAAVERWRMTASLTDRAVKQALPGPFSLGGGAATADALAEVAIALAEGGCRLVEIEETAIDRLADEDQRRQFRSAHERLLERVSGTHLSLSIAGGAPDSSAWATVYELPYASLAVDLIAGPDNWNLVTRWAGDRGVIAGVESGRDEDEPKEVLLWAARYAASTRGRGLDRVGIGSAGSWANLTWEAAVRKMRLLGEAARLASMPAGDELAASIDPRAVNARAAALGTTVRPKPRPRR
jgi:hypothetical protein